MNNGSSGFGEISESRESEQSEAPAGYGKSGPELILERVPALIAYVDANGCYKWVNQEYKNWYGMAAEGIVGRPALEVLREWIGSEYAEQLRPRMEEALRGADVTFEASHHFGGKRHDLVLSYRPDRDETGAVRGFVLLVTDQSEQKRIGRELKASEERFRTLTETLPSVVWTASTDGEIDYLSGQFREITGVAAEAGLGSAWLDVIHPDDVEETVARWKAALERGTLFDKRYRVRQRDGSYRWYVARALPQRDPSGNIVRWVGVSTDIHRQVTAEEEIRESERKYRLLFDDNPLPMMTYDTRTLCILSVNESAIAKYGYSREEFLRLRLSDIRPPEDVAALLPMMRNPPQGQSIGPVRHRRKDGGIFWVQHICHSLSQGNPATRLVVSQDVTEQVRLDEELARRANYDALTGLPNRSLLLERYRQAVERAKATGQRIALLAIDFDRFKHVNDIFGHQIGDEFLCISTRRLLGRLRPSDTLARLGGDEFVALAEGMVTGESCAQTAERLMGALSEPVAVRDIQLQSSISVGLAVYPDDGEELDDLLRHADFALYRAKRAGRACWKRYSREETWGIQEAMEIERGLRNALQRGGFALHYQPIFSHDREIVKLEALIRFAHPALGLLPPARFIPIAEESGMITPIGLWALHEVCRQIRQWRAEGLRAVPVAVNVSAVQFLRGDLARDIREIVEEYGIEPEMLEVELTESVLMENTEQSWQQLRLLKETGIRITVDDFGTGYSSLSYLHWLPLDSLKIDGSFVQKITSGKPNPIVRAIVDLGRNLGLSVVAEGVETTEQYQELVRIDCDLLQGFLFSAPKPAAEIACFLLPEGETAAAI